MKNFFSGWISARLTTVALLTMLFCQLPLSRAIAQKTVYIPVEWRQQRTDTLIYKESDPEGKYTWSKTRSVESDNVIIFWDKFYTKNPKELSKSDYFYVDIDDLLQKCEAFFDLEINQLGFVDPQNSNLSKYKVMVLMNHTKDWVCYGGGYDYQISALWLSPSTCKPVGHSVAHEVGHSFHYMCYAEHSGHKESSTDGTGFHLPVGNGQAIWEQTAQWQAAQSYPELMFSQSFPIFRYTHNYAFSHEWHRYQSYWFHYYLCQHYGDIKTVANVWNQPMTGSSDFNQALVKLKGLTPKDLYKLYFDYACRCVTWDLDACVPYRDNYVGNFEYRCVLTGDGDYQVALASCPQGTGFNVIPLKVPQAGTAVTTHLTGLKVGSALLNDDPGEYYNGSSVYTKYASRRYVSGGAQAYRGFRMGYVALMQDGTRQYFSQDSVYCTGTKTEAEDFTAVLPEGVSRLWLVVSPALSRYVQHKWDENIMADDMWPYKFSVEGTDLGPSAVVYVAPTLDGRAIGNTTITYDVTFPRDATGYSGTTLTIGGQAAATLGTAFQMKPTDIGSIMQTWTSQGPTDGHVMFYAVAANGNLVQRGSTANGYGHWFNANGAVCDYGSGYVFSEFNPATLTFTLGQFPNKCGNGARYTIRQALRYRQTAGQYAVATFVFNITVGGAANAELSDIQYSNPDGLDDQPRLLPADCQNATLYNLQGQKVSVPHEGIYVTNGRKYIAK